VPYKPKLTRSLDYYEEQGGSTTESDPVFTASEAANFVTGDKTKLDNIEAGAEVNNISDVNATDLTDGGATTLHKHDHGGMDGLADDDHSQYIHTAPTASTRNVIQPTGAALIPFILKAAASQTANLLEFQDSTGTAKTSFGPTGRLGIGTTPDYAFRLLETTTIRTGAGLGSMIDVSAQPSGTYTGFTFYAALYARAIYDSNIDGSARARLRGFWGSTFTTSTSTGNLLEAAGLYFIVQHQGSGTVTSATAAYSSVSLLGSPTGANTGDITNAYNYLALCSNTKSSGTIANRYGLRVEETTGTGALTNQYGVYIAALARGGTINYQIYSEAGKVFLSGPVGINVLNPVEKLEIDGNIKSTGYKSSDGTSGATATTAGASFKNGLYTGGEIVAEAGEVPVYDADGTQYLIALASSQFPVYDASGTQYLIALI
jgi:hypothetical protein